MDYIFEKNERAVRYGNHVSDIDAAYCAKCGVDIMHPVFDHTLIACSQVPEECPHRRVNYAEAARKPVQVGPAGDSLTFTALRVANRARLPLFKNAAGETKHSGQDWTVSDWALAVAGETGELAEVLLLYSRMTMSLGKAENIMKKMRRKDFNTDIAISDISEELADVVIYLDMLADSLGLDLGKATMCKWNKKSEQLDIPLRLYETHVERIEEY